jgi:hypothetical protein
MRWELTFIVLMVAGCSKRVVEPEKMIENSIAAHGGKENLAAVTMLKIQGTSTGEGVDLTWEETIHFPGRVRKTLKGKFAGQTKDNLFVQNGDRAWSKDEGRETIVTAPNWEAGGILGQIISLPNLSELKDKKFTPIGDFKLAGRTVAGIKLENTEIYFDKKSWLMAGNKIKLSVQPKEAIVETSYFDYKDFAGAKLPQKLEVKLNGAPFVTQQITKIEILDKLDDSSFDKPN